MKTLLITASALLFSSLSSMAYADANEGVLEGKYVPVSGFSHSREVSRVSLGEAPKQVGKFKVVFKREGWAALSEEDKNRIRKRLVIKGEYTGVMNMSNQTLAHTMVNKDKSGTLYSEGDFLIPSQGDPFCSAGEPLQGVEQMNIVAGTGEFANISSGTLFLKADVNNCPGTDGFLSNKFEFVAGEGSLEFSSSN